MPIRGPRLYQGDRPPPPWPHAGYGPDVTKKFSFNHFPNEENSPRPK